MDPNYSGFFNSQYGYEWNDDETAHHSSHQQNSSLDPNLMGSYNQAHLPAPAAPVPAPAPEPEPEPEPEPMVHHSGHEKEFSDAIFQYIGQMLMEEDMEMRSCMFHDPLALQAAEKSFYDAIGQKYPLSPTQLPPPTGRNLNGDHGCRNSNEPSFLQSPVNLPPVDYVFQATPQIPSTFSINSFSDVGVGAGTSTCSFAVPLVPSTCIESDSILQFRRGMEEASKFLPSTSLLTIDLESHRPPLGTNERDYLPCGGRGRKNHSSGDIDVEEGRTSKQLAVCFDEVELSEMFDRVLLCPESNKNGPSSSTGDNEALPNRAGGLPQQNVQTYLFNAGKGCRKEQRKEKEVVDLRALLIHCSRAVTNNDHRSANELLKEIRKYSSPFGDGTQRTAHYFANALEARLAGTGTQIYAGLARQRTSATNMLKAYQLYLSTCPFTRMAIFFANHLILKLARTATTLHIIDFGILYGFQWPIVIQRLADGVGQPSKLRITAIELPQPGFRPAERVEETGRRLGKYCERFNIPFEYKCIAQKWETVQIEELRLDRNETIVVNCLFGFKNLLDGTVLIDSPRDAVLVLIRKINPQIFIHSVVNGSYDAALFAARFREALFHYSALFDMFDTNLTRENQERLMFEKEFYGREVMNVLACEGSERVERPETYRQWQARNMSAQFRQLPLDRELLMMLKTRVKAAYHKDFLIDEDGPWMLQGWKGRIICATTSWIPAEDSWILAEQF
ncbi:scarecrow-like protein 33 [Malania oleifera]|uniref:scarecrow-like protein 33 n=1 Tax=Malania oleifera TaxID=397392 RepID=UPI0025AE3872|nr:scarecrow-like protein 33 [Malania oleifera]